LALAGDCWLIDETATQRHGIVVEGTDIARQRLSGVPLASWDNVIAAPLTDNDVVVIVARQAGRPFGAEDLKALVTAADRHAAALSSALELRMLARALQRFADLEMLD
jgi:hypothetical protein